MDKVAKMSSAEVQELSEFLKALAGETRQQILSVFSSSAEERTVNEVAERLGIGQSTASENLARLKRSGILEARRSGKTVYYRPNRARALQLVNQLKTYLETCCAKPDD